jgi:gliding motility-associated-like protein
MRKILPFLLLSLFVPFFTNAQIPVGGYRLDGSPISWDRWIKSPNITTGTSSNQHDEIIMVNGPNEVGNFRYESKRKLFFCDSTLVEFDFKIEPNAGSGTADGFAFWMLTDPVLRAPLASPGLGIPDSSTGHVVVFDFFDNDNNSNNPLIGVRQLNKSNYVEGQNAGTDTQNVNLPLGTWHKATLVYTFNGNSATAPALNLEIYINNIRYWTGAAPATLLTTPVEFGFSSSTGAVNASKVSLREVKISPLPLPAEIIVPRFCSGQLSLPFIYPSGGNAVWYDSLNDLTPSLQAPVVNTANVDTFTYYFAWRKAMATGGYCFGDKQEVVVVVHQSPIVNFTYSKVEGCGADTITFINLSDLTTADRFQWEYGDGTDAFVFEEIHFYNGEGDYRVKLKGENDYCSDTTVQVLRLENPFRVSFEVDKDSICQNGFVEILNTSAVTDKNNIPTKWKWDFGVAAWDTLLVKDPPSKYYYEPGTYAIKLSVTNGLPCTDSFTKVIVVDPAPQLTFVRSDTSFCQGDDVTLNATVEEGGLNSLTWDFGDGGTQYVDVTNLTKSFDVPGVYTITATADYRVCQDSVFTKQILVKPIPLVNLPKDTTLCYLESGFEVFDAINATNDAATYLWSTGDTTQILAVKNPGHYGLKVTVDGCTGYDEIVVSKDCYINIPNAFSPDGDGINDYFIPRSSETQNIGEFKMTIYNRYGEVIFETNRIDGKGWDGRYNGKEQPLGVYVYSIQLEFKNGHKENYTGNVTLVR